MNKELLTISEDLLKKIDKISKFGSSYSVYPYREVSSLIAELNSLAGKFPDIEEPKNQDELYQAELKRRLKGEAFFLEQYMSGDYTEFDTAISVFGIPKEDLQNLKPWLLENKEKTLDTIERLFRTKDLGSHDLGLPTDIPGIKRQSEEFANAHIQKYHKKLGKLVQELTDVGQYLREITAVPTNEMRSYFNPLNNNLAIGIPAICFTTEDGTMHIKEEEVIRIYGHEGMGHALNNILTKSNGLPHFLTHDSRMTTASMESVAQYFQKRILEDLKRSKQTQKDLGIEHRFDEMYEESHDRRLLNEYNLRLEQYAIIVLGDKSLGDPKSSETVRKKIDLLEKVTLDPNYPKKFIGRNMYNFDPEGNLNHTTVSELVYCANPVQRALAEFEKQGMTYEKDRSTIDEVLLKGFWTPIGFVQNARLKAEKK